MPPGASSGRIVVVTGAAGAMGSLVVRQLGSRWRIRATDLRPAPGVTPLDITDAEACRRAFGGADAVVHLAANPDPAASWDDLRAANVEGTYAVAMTVRELGIRRLVVASSLQAVSAYPAESQRRTDDPPRPANLYGATKAWAEALGSWVASTSSTSVVALRIGFFSERPPSGEESAARDLGAWLSHGDCVKLVRSAVESPRPAGFVVVNGISANRFRTAELGDTGQTIGYQPASDAWCTDRNNVIEHGLNDGRP